MTLNEYIKTLEDRVSKLEKDIDIDGYNGQYSVTKMAIATTLYDIIDNLKSITEL